MESCTYRGCAPENNGIAAAHVGPKALESTPNVKTFLGPYISEIKLMKKNCSILVVMNGDNYRCCVLSCNPENKHDLDNMWRVHNKLSCFHEPKSMKEAETCNSQSNSTVINHSIDRIFTFEEEHTAQSSWLSRKSYQEFFICCYGTQNVEYLQQHVGFGVVQLLWMKWT